MKHISVVVICAALLTILSPSVGMTLNGLWLQKRQDPSPVTHDPVDVLTPVNEATPLPDPPAPVATPASGGVGGGSGDPTAPDAGDTQSDGSSTGGPVSSETQGEIAALDAALSAGIVGTVADPS